jgi:hypothetical protein
MVELKERQVVPERPVLALHVLAEEARVCGVYLAANLGQQVIATDALPQSGRTNHRHRQPYRATVHLGTLRRRYLVQGCVSGSHLRTRDRRVHAHGSVSDAHGVCQGRLPLPGACERQGMRSPGGMGGVCIPAHALAAQSPYL